MRLHEENEPKERERVRESEHVRTFEVTMIRIEVYVNGFVQTGFSCILFEA